MKSFIKRYFKNLLVAPKSFIKNAKLILMILGIILLTAILIFSFMPIFLYTTGMIVLNLNALPMNNVNLDIFINQHPFLEGFYLVISTIISMILIEALLKTIDQQNNLD